MCTVKPYDILKLKNSMVNSLHYVRAYIMLNLVIFQRNDMYLYWIRCLERHSY